MTTNTPAETANGSTGETPASETVTTPETQTATSEGEGNGASTSESQQETRLPDDHPLVKAYASSQEQLRQLKGTSQASQSKVQELETQVAELTTKATSAEGVQAKYDRLEAFLTGLGGPISRALDSKSFTKALFESDADVKELVAQWHRDNPSATSSALNSGAGNTSGAVDMNALLRKAAQ